MPAREDQKRYRKKHAKKLRIHALAYYHAHKDRDADKRKERNKNNWIKNRIRMLINFQERYEDNKNAIGAKHRADPRPRMLSSARTRANKKGLEFSITLEDVHVPLFCPVFGTKLRVGGAGDAPSLDRIDNSRGYVRGNVWVISDRANRIKRDATLAELQLLVKRLEKGVNSFPWESK